MASSEAFKLTLKGNVVECEMHQGGGETRRIQQKDRNEVVKLKHNWSLTEGVPVWVIGKRMAGRVRFDKLSDRTDHW